MQYIKRSLVVLAFTAVIGHADAVMFVLGELSDNIPRGYSTNTFADKSTLVLHPPKQDTNSGVFYSVIESRGRPLHTYLGAPKILGRSDYGDVHFLILYGQKKVGAPGASVVADNGEEWNIDRYVNLKLFISELKELAIGISRNKELLLVKKPEVDIINLKTGIKTTIKLPATFMTAHIGTDGDRRWAIIGIDGEQKVWMGNGKQWVYSQPGEYGDREKVLSVFPNGDNELVGAVYTYINPYNKGVMLLYGQLLSGQLTSPSRQAWAINSDEMNYGFFPAVQWQNEIIEVAGINSSENKPFSISIPEDVVRTMSYQVPPHAENFQEAESMSAMVGVSLARLDWKIKSDVEGLSNVEYEIANSLFKGVNIEGRYQNHNLAVSYLRNETEEKALQSGGVLVREASSLLFGYMDFDSWISSSHSMRLTVDKADLKGVATYRDTNGKFQSSTFNNQYSKFGLWDIGERGKYFKGEYTNSKLPIAVGFGSGGTASVSYFDPDARFQEISFGIGYDEPAYAKRYESSYQRWYLSGAGSIGLGRVDISDAVKQKAQMALGKDVESSSLFIGVHMIGELGYMIQQRSKYLRGFGHSFSVGLRLQYDNYSDGQKSSNNNSGNLADISFSRQDSLYGLFARYNLVF